MYASYVPVNSTEKRASSWLMEERKRVRGGG